MITFIKYDTNTSINYFNAKAEIHRSLVQTFVTLSKRPSYTACLTTLKGVYQ